MRIRDGKIRIRDKHPGSATPACRTWASRPARRASRWGASTLDSQTSLSAARAAARRSILSWLTPPPPLLSFPALGPPTPPPPPPRPPPKVITKFYKFLEGSDRWEKRGGREGGADDIYWSRTVVTDVLLSFYLAAIPWNNSISFSAHSRVQTNN
jgi:hypothetical protein